MPESFSVLKVVDFSNVSSEARARWQAERAATWLTEEANHSGKSEAGKWPKCWITEAEAPQEPAD